MDISHRGPNYEVPKATVDGEPHEIIVLVAVVAGAILASIILIILVALIERSKKKQPTSPSPDSTNSIYRHPPLNHSISTISDRVSMASDKSYCSGIVIDGQVRCCQKALENAGKSTSEVSLTSSGISSGSDYVPEDVPKISHNNERELKMSRPKTIQGILTRESTIIEVVTKC